MKDAFHMGIPPKGYAAGLVILSLFFLSGAVAACLLVAASTDEALLPFMTDYTAALSAGVKVSPSWISSLFGAFLYPTLAFFCGFSALGAVLIPLILAARGFFMSLAVASFFKVFGADGLLMALCVEGVAGLLTIPCLFLIGLYAFFSSLSLLSLARGGARKTPLYGAPYFSRYAVCFPALIGSAAFQMFAVPALLPWAVSAFL